MLRTGALGQVTTIRQRNATPGAEWAGWFYDPEQSGGVVAQLGVHGIDLLRYLFGEISQVLAIESTSRAMRRLADDSDVPVDTADFATALYRFDSGLLGVHEMSYREVAGTDRFRMEVYGDEGTAWLRSERGEFAWAHSIDGEVTWHTPALPPGDFGVRHHAHVLAMVRGDEPLDTRLRWFAALRIVEAIDASAARGLDTGGIMIGEPMPPIRFALLGVAHYHANFWAEAIAQMPGEAVLAGIWDADAERGREFAARHGLAFEPDLDALLSRIDAAGVTSETAGHRALIAVCAEAGVHVLCEKPLAPTAQECAAIAAIERESGIIIRQTFPKRTDPINDEVRALLAQGVLGEITLVRIRHGHRHALGPNILRQWYADPALSGGGALIDEGVHAADFLNWLFERPSAVSATTRTHLPGLRVEDTACATFRWPSGLLAEVSVSWTFVAAAQSIEIFGTAGTMVVDGVDIASRTRASSPFLRWYLQDGAQITRQASETLPRFVSGDFHHEGPRRFVRLLRGGLDDLPTVADGVAALELIFAAYAAAASDRAEPVRKLESR